MENTIYYLPTEQEFQEFLESSEHAEGVILAEFQERIKKDYSAPAGDGLEAQLEKLGLTLQAI
jgi:hypothetical protein